MRWVARANWLALVYGWVRWPGFSKLYAIRLGLRATTEPVAGFPIGGSYPKYPGFLIMSLNHTVVHNSFQTAAFTNNGYGNGYASLHFPLYSYSFPSFLLVGP